MHEQVDAAFASTDRLARGTAIDRFVASGAVGLTEEPFRPAIDADVAEAWDDALDGLQRYADLLATLVDERRGAAASDAVTDLGRRIETGHLGVKLAPAVAAGFAALAGILVDEAAGRRAKEVMTRADPTVRALLRAMADAVGADRLSGLRGTALSNWTTSLNRTRAAYAIAAEKRDERAQRALVADYLSALDHRDADLRALVALRSSLLSLGDAHTAAAVGAAPGQQAVLDAMERRLDQTRRSFDQLSKQQGDVR